MKLGDATGYKDDGERWGGETVLRSLLASKLDNVVVIVSRWFGGTLLGPLRFQCITRAVVNVCQVWTQICQELDRLEIIQNLTRMDNEIEEIEGNVVKKSNYFEFDTIKLSRLANAKEKRILYLKSKIK